MNLREVAAEIGTRLARTFLNDEDGRRPVFGGIEKFQSDPHWHDLLLFHEYFHGDNGAGIGASHQTGWTGTVASLFLAGGELYTRCRPVDGLGGLRHARCACPPRPTVYEINTAVWLERLGRGRGRALTLERGARRRVGRARRAAGRRGLADGGLAAQPCGPADRARATPSSSRATAARCRICASEDVIGSPYCVRDYVVDARFGGAAGTRAGAGGSSRAAASA